MTDTNPSSNQRFALTLLFDENAVDGRDVMRAVEKVPGVTVEAMRCAPDETSRDDAIDAAKWRALRNCARITAMGCAGLTQPHNVADDYAHLTLNFWTGISDGDSGPGYAREWLDKFVAKALRSSPEEPRCICAKKLDGQIIETHIACELHGVKASSFLTVSPEEAKRPRALRHWSKDLMVPVDGCHCDTCVEARDSEKASGHPVMACIFRDGCRKFPACMTEDRCCGNDASIPKTR